MQSESSSFYPVPLSTAAQAALQAASMLPAADPVPAISYVSQGRLLVVGSAEQALPWAKLLDDTLQVEVLLPKPVQIQGIPVQVGRVQSIHGWLGDFAVDWGAGEKSYDLILDLLPMPLFSMHLPPQGYFRVADNAMSAAAVAKELVQAIGEFEKPKYFAYDEKLCAHSRSGKAGCNNCIDICSTRAIRGLGDKVVVEPHLCMGCGACASVCPSGAMRYNYPSVAYLGERVHAMLAAYRQAGAGRPILLVHNDGADLAQLLDGVDAADLLPFAVQQVPSVGLDLLFYALAAGAGGVVIAAPAHEAPQYLAALREQILLAHTILHGLGYAGVHLAMAEHGQLAPALSSLSGGSGLPEQPAAFKPFNEKRTTLEFCLDYFVKETSAGLPEVIALPAGAPFGEVRVDQSACTLCMSCVSACPAAALRDTPGQPILRFIERNCVQCGLCENTCPEQAITLSPRLLLGAQAKQPRTLHEDAPFHCIRCGQVFGTTRMVANMQQKLAGHSMFATPEARRRLQMCGDCRVLDMMDGA